jgi:hypothetical protein
MAHTVENTTGYKAFTATATAIGVGVRVKLNAGSIEAAGATDPWIGTTVSAIAASGTGTVRLRNAPGTHMFVAAGAIDAGDMLYPAASGKVDDVAAGVFTGFQAIAAAAADGDIFEAVPCDNLDWTAHADQAVATDAASVITLANALRTALINAGIIKGAA